VPDPRLVRVSDDANEESAEACSFPHADRRVYLSVILVPDSMPVRLPGQSRHHGQRTAISAVIIIEPIGPASPTLADVNISGGRRNV
jgi:hypothetical protein